MSNVVLALLTKMETAPTVLAGAQRLAALLGDAQIEAMVVKTAPISTILPTEEILTKNEERNIRVTEGHRASALHRVYESWANDYDGKTAPRWIEEEGTPKTLMESWGCRADYIVVGRPDADADQAEHDALHAALFGTERPVLVMPPRARADFGKVIAIAWRDDKFTLRAVMAALRCVPHAKQVHVLMGHREGEPPAHIPDALTEHSIPVVAHELQLGEETFGAQLLGQAHEVEADMLVMGAFTHSSWHDLLFGGVTKYVLSHDADIPVLMRH